MIGGDKDAVATVTPLFELMGTTMTHCGGAGMMRKCLCVYICVRKYEG